MSLWEVSMFGEMLGGKASSAKLQIYCAPFQGVGLPFTVDICLQVVKTAKIRQEHVPVNSSFDFKFCRIREPDEIFPCWASELHMRMITPLTLIFLMSSSRCEFMSKVDECHFLHASLLSLVSYTLIQVKNPADCAGTMTTCSNVLKCGSSYLFPHRFPIKSSHLHPAVTILIDL